MFGRTASQAPLAAALVRGSTCQVTSRAFCAATVKWDAMPTKIHHWAERQNFELMQKLGNAKDMSLSKMLEHQKLDAKNVKKYQAVGSFVCKPEHSVATLGNHLSGKGVPDGLVRAWLMKWHTNGTMSEGFEQESGHNTTADGQATTGAYRGSIEVTTLPSGEHEIFYCVAGMQLKTAQKIKEYKEVTMPVLGQKAEEVTVQKKGIFGCYEEVEVREVVRVVDYSIKQVPVLCPTEAAQWDAYESVMDVVDRDATMEFQNVEQRTDAEAFATAKSAFFSFLSWQSPLSQYRDSMEEAVLQKRLEGQAQLRF